MNLEKLAIGNNSNIVVVKQDGTIVRKLIYTPDLKNEIENLLKEECSLEVYNPSTFGASEGENRNHFNKEGVRFSNSLLLEKGLLTLDDDKKIDDDDNIVEMSELEKFEMNPEQYPTKKIETYEEKSLLTTMEGLNVVSGEKWKGLEYLTEKTMKEKFDDNLITKEEYNEHIIEERIKLYSKFDGRQIEIIRLKNMLLITEDEYQVEILAIQNMIDKIKEKYKKV